MASTPAPPDPGTLRPLRGLPLAALLLLSAAGPGPVAAAGPRDTATVTPPADDARAGPARAAPASDTLETFRDEAARRLIRLAREARRRVDSTLRRQAVTFRERIHVGVDAERLRRERALFGQQRAARVLWRRDGDRVVRWLGARRQAPGADAEIDFGDLDDTFSFLDPGAEVLFLGGEWAVHPLADSAGRHYRFRSGDTLRIGFPGAERTVEVAEVLVEPREARSDLVTASLWFDTESGALARAVYRPARDPAAGDVPAFLEPVDLRVDYIVVEYGLERLRWWRPRRVAFEGTARFTGFFRFPARLEWTFGDYALNREVDVASVEEAPAGWRREVKTAGADADSAGPDPAAGDSTRRTVILVPPRDSLRTAPELPEPFASAGSGFDPAELARLGRRLERIELPEKGLPAPTLGLGLGPGLVRYNRVEALAAGAGVEVPLGPRTVLDARGLVATASGEPDLRLRLRRDGPDGGWGIAAYRGLAAAGDHGDPLGLGNSLNALLLGQDDGLYYRRLGGAVTGRLRAGLARLSGRLFVERHRNAAPRTDASLPDLFGDDRLEGELGAERGTVAGLAGRLRLQGGVDPSSPVLAGELRAEAADGDFDYGRLSASGMVATAPDRPWAAGAELRVGTTTGRPPAQRGFFLGGPYTLRGFPPGSLRGRSVWTVRLEVGRSLLPGGPEAGRALRAAGAPGSGGGRLLRGVLFADLGWAGDRSDFGRPGPAASVGAGLSVLDGLFRVDVARAVEDGEGWRVHLYRGGLF